MVSADGEQLGILPIAQALDLARQREMDLVEVAAEAQIGRASWRGTV